ncbi:MAG: BMP family ABC transporter substrate-binding protein [Eubacteriales bacterium]|nr:BMP family ABC transporter substrate-binding protein [Eubacteriales bacterium]
MKKILALALSLIMVGTLVSCSSNTTNQGAVTEDTQAQTTQAQKSETYELALVTDLGTIDDKSFNQGSWEGLVQYAQEKNVSHKYYQPQSKETSSYIETIELAIEGGAKVIVCPGYLFEEPVFEVQSKYPNIKFILIDGEPHSGDYSVYKTENNVMAVLFKEDQAGYLAGYAAVKEGMTELGFMGGMAVPAVVRFGYGFVQGADAAAKELGKTINVKYHYTGAFAATPEAQAMAASWFNGGTEVIFGCGGAVGNSVMAAAESAGKKVIGVDVDQYAESNTVITSAIKQLGNAVYSGIESVYNNNFPGGKTSVFTVENDGVGIAMEHNKFTTFTEDDYAQIYSKMRAGSINIIDDVSVTDTSNIKDSLTATKVDFVG